MITTTAQKLAITINLDDLRDLMAEFANEHESNPDLRESLCWTLETFLQWLKKRQEKTDGKKSN